MIIFNSITMLNIVQFRLYDMSGFGKLSALAPPILNFMVRIMVRFKIGVRFRVMVRMRVKDRIRVGMIFRVKVWFYQYIGGLMGGNFPQVCLFCYFVYFRFKGGEISICYNAIDRHVEAGHGDMVAIIHDSPVTKSIVKITYKELLDKVSTLLIGLNHTLNTVNSLNIRNIYVLKII